MSDEQNDPQQDEESPRERDDNGRLPHRADEIKRDDEAVEESAEDSFPASDPPSYSGGTGGERPDPDEEEPD